MVSRLFFPPPKKTPPRTSCSLTSRIKIHVRNKLTKVQAFSRVRQRSFCTSADAGTRRRRRRTEAARTRSPARCSLQESTAMLRGDLSAAQARTPLLPLPLPLLQTPLHSPVTPPPPSPPPTPAPREKHARTRTPSVAFQAILY